MRPEGSNKLHEQVAQNPKGLTALLLMYLINLSLKLMWDHMCPPGGEKKPYLILQVSQFCLYEAEKYISTIRVALKENNKEKSFY